MGFDGAGLALAAAGFALGSVLRTFGSRRGDKGGFRPSSEAELGLQKYFDAVGAGGVTSEEKLKLICKCFSKDCELINAQTGHFYRGREGVRSFYSGPNSPVMKDPNFKPYPKWSTLSTSGDGTTIAVEIALTVGYSPSELPLRDLERLMSHEMVTSNPQLKASLAAIGRDAAKGNQGVLVPSKVIFVGDFFTFEGREITRMVIYSGNLATKGQ